MEPKSRNFTIGAILLLVTVTGECAATDSTLDENAMLRSDLYHMQLSDGSLLSIRTTLRPSRGPQTAEVWAVLHPPGTVYEKQPVRWGIRFTTVDHVPGSKGHYALAKVTGDRVTLFATWNAHYCTLDRKTGKAIAQGDGDDILTEFEEMRPLKLLVVPPAVGREMTTREIEEMKRKERER